MPKYLQHVTVLQGKCHWQQQWQKVLLNFTDFLWCAQICWSFSLHVDQHS